MLEFCHCTITYLIRALLRTGVTSTGLLEFVIEVLFGIGVLLLLLRMLFREPSGVFGSSILILTFFFLDDYNKKEIRKIEKTQQHTRVPGVLIIGTKES